MPLSIYGVKFTAAERQARYRARKRGEHVPDVIRRNTPEERKAKKAQWEEANKERVRELGKRWRDANRELLRERQAASRAANRERNRTYQKRYYDANREEIRARTNPMTIAWRQANPEKVREGAAKGRRRRQAAIKVCAHASCLVIGPIQLAWMVNPHRCYLCGVAVQLGARVNDPSKCEMDHVVPITRGGLHCAENLRPTCRPCNRRKHTKLLSEMGIAA